MATAVTLGTLTLALTHPAAVIISNTAGTTALAFADALAAFASFF